MSMSQRGLTKLLEECGEVSQVAAKLIAYPGGTHPDGGKDLYLRLEDELADIDAARIFVTEKLSLNDRAMARRTLDKLKKFREWDRENT